MRQFELAPAGTVSTIRRSIDFDALVAF